MKKITLILIIGMLSATQTLFAQETNYPVNAATTLLKSNDKISIGGYAQIDYNQPFNDSIFKNGIMDVHRMVLLFGYNFNSRVSFISEIEMEHVSELYVEQAFLNYKINNFINFRGGLMLIPMGIINEYHEPSTFNGVERPNLDSKIVPTTWREIGAGFTGNLSSLKTQYQLYLINGFKSYDGAGLLRGSDGLRKGRQKGAESMFTHLNFSGKVDYYGINRLKLGLAGYFGKTQSSLYNNLKKDNKEAIAKADSSIVGISMLGLDARYQIKGLEIRAQYIIAKLGNTEEYNALTSMDLGAAMNGYYLEVAYNILKNCETIKNELLIFSRYENYNTHGKVAGNLAKNKSYQITEITAGLGFKLDRGAVLKADWQLIKPDSGDKFANQFNAGIGIWF